MNATIPPVTEELAVLREMPIFGGVPDRALQYLSDRAERIGISAGDWFFRQGDRDQTMYVLRSGHVEVRRTLGGRSETLGRLGPGDCFGEMALIDLYPRSASVRAVEDCLALGIGHGLLYALYAEDPEPFTLIAMNLARSSADDCAGPKPCCFGTGSPVACPGSAGPRPARSRMSNPGGPTLARAVRRPPEMPWA